MTGRRIKREPSFAAGLFLWAAMMDVHTTNKCHLFNPLSTYSHFEVWILFVEQNHSQAMGWGLVTEMMLGPVWAKIKSPSIISQLENSPKVLIQIKSNPELFKCFILHSCWENNPWGEIFTWSYTQNMTYIYSCFRLHKRKKQRIKKAQVLQAQGLDFKSELRNSVF